MATLVSRPGARDEAVGPQSEARHWKFELLALQHGKAAACRLRSLLPLHSSYTRHSGWEGSSSQSLTRFCRTDRGGRGCSSQGRVGG